MTKPIVHKKYLKLYEETATERVFEVLLKFPDSEFSLSDLAKESGTAKANIGSILAEFQELDMITIEKLSKIWRIKANQNNPNFIKSKIVYNLNVIYQSDLVEFLNEYFGNPRAIILFGTFRQGEDISKSDIDIAIETDDVDEYKTTGLRELADFEKNFERSIQLHIFNRKNIDLNLFNSIANGIVLSGFLEVNK